MSTTAGTSLGDDVAELLAVSARVGARLAAGEHLRLDGPRRRVWLRTWSQRPGSGRRAARCWRRRRGTRGI